MSVNTIIFEFDNVISLDNSELIFSKYKDIIKDPSFNVKLLASKSLYDALRGQITHEQYLSDFARIADIDLESAKIISNDLIETRMVSPEMINLLLKLKAQNYNLILYTDMRKVPFDKWIRKFELRSYFDFMICSAHIGSLKSNAVSFEKVLKFTKTKPENCLMIDSNTSNIYTAEKVGIKTIHFIDSLSLMRELESAGIYLES